MENRSSSLAALVIRSLLLPGNILDQIQLGLVVLWTHSLNYLKLRLFNELTILEKH